MPMEVDFMVNDTLEVGLPYPIDNFSTLTLVFTQALRPKLVFGKSFEEAATAVDAMFDLVALTGDGMNLSVFMYQASLNPRFA
jgi:hypothetical protein